MPLGPRRPPSNRDGPHHPPQGECRPIVAKSVGRCGCSRHAHSHWEPGTVADGPRGWEWHNKASRSFASIGPLVPPLVPNEDPIVRWPTPVLDVVRMVQTNPPLVAAFPIRALPQIAAANIRKALHELHLDVRARHFDQEPGLGNMRCLGKSSNGCS